MTPVEQFLVYRADTEANVFRREGHYWTLAYSGTLVRLRDSKGLRDIAKLIERSGSTLHVSELASASASANSRSAEEIERARVAVTMRIRNALGRIRREHHALGQHLSHAIKTGTSCTYEPEIPTIWKL
ncbi:MAG TPA: hypothetical protein VGR71_12905 [Nitrospira sp.]|nr:hypothetical protein [Nitrospira sp.]